MKDLLLKILSLIKELLMAKQTPESPSVPSVSLTDPTVPLTTEPKPIVNHSTAWRGGTLTERTAMYNLVNAVCIAEGVQNLMRDIQATIAGESGWNQWCENHGNRNGTADYGIAQFNSGRIRNVPMWIGGGATFKDKDEVLNNPEKCIRVMARQFKLGHASWWYAWPSRQKYYDTKPV